MTERQHLEQAAANETPSENSRCEDTFPEHNRELRAAWKEKHQQYFFHIPQAAASARENLQLYLRQLDRDIAKGKANNLTDQQCQKVEKEARVLYMTIKGLEEIDGQDVEYQDFVLDIFRRQRLLDAREDQFCSLRRVIAASKSGDTKMKRPLQLHDDECAHIKADEKSNKITLHQVQDFYLSFCKYVCLIVVNNQIQSSQEGLEASPAKLNSIADKLVSL